MTVTPQEQQVAAMEIPAIYVTQTLVSWGPDGVRLSFGEESSVGGIGAVRAAVFMSAANLKHLSKAIATVIEQMETKMPVMPEVTSEVPATVN